MPNPNTARNVKKQAMSFCRGIDFPRANERVVAGRQILRRRQSVTWRGTRRNINNSPQGYGAAIPRWLAAGSR
jgi:hypothetical protein